MQRPIQQFIVVYGTCRHYRYFRRSLAYHHQLEAQCRVYQVQAVGILTWSTSIEPVWNHNFLISPNFLGDDRTGR
jgi:hypothetical protein